MSLLRELPKIDKLVANEAFVGLNKQLITKISRELISSLREGIKAQKVDNIDKRAMVFEILQKYHEFTKSSLNPLINATGIILHTNLGRSPLHVEVFERAKNIACGYSNLEFDMKKGKRGERYEHVSKLLCTLLDTQDALVVNNNAAAVFLVLNTFAKGKKVVLSRGELVEIGGSFRVPDVMRESGAKLKEIGTTNKTKLDDYKKAIGKNTAILMKVHKSNFSIKGFSEEVGLNEIVKLAKKEDLIDYYDAGGAYVGDLGLTESELCLDKILNLKPSLISFSGDKLFGSVQAGIIVGNKKLIKRLKQNQLLRMLRVDKITLSLLEATIQAYLEDKSRLIPALNLLKKNETDLNALCLHVSKNLPKDSCEIVKTSSFIGGGTLPDKPIPSLALHVKGNAKNLKDTFRNYGVIGRIEKDKFLLDFRSILPKNITPLIKILKEIL